MNPTFTSGPAGQRPDLVYKGSNIAGKVLGQNWLCLPGLSQGGNLRGWKEFFNMLLEEEG